jgi:hypothetical protein
MRENHVTQAMLRAGRNKNPVVVFAHSAALRDDLPIDDEGIVLSAHSKGTLAVDNTAKEYQYEPFTAQDIVDGLDSHPDAISEQRVQNILSQLTKQGYLRRVREAGPGVGHKYEFEEDHGHADI